MRVLVLEDYLPLQKNIVECLSEDGYVVDASADGSEGLAGNLGGQKLVHLPDRCDEVFVVLPKIAEPQR